MYMFNLFHFLFGNPNTIANRVMNNVKQRIAEAQRAQDAYCKQVEEEHEAKVAAMETAMLEGKEANMEALVATILGK